MKLKYHDALYNYIKTGGQGLTVSAKSRVLRFRLPTLEDIVGSNDYASFEIEKSAYLLASCLQSVGGFNVPHSMRYDVLKHFLSTPKFIKRVISYHWVCVRESHSYADYFEAFCYTQKSRLLWEEWKQSSSFGFNFFAQDFPLTDLQKSWISYNQAEDKKIKIEDEWSRAFFIASTMNPKGVQKVQRDWEGRKKKDQDYREKMVKEAEKGGLTPEKRDVLKEEKSVEQLQSEYWDWIDGKEDQHDKAVREYKEQVQRHIEKQRELIGRQTRDAIEMAEQVQALNSLSINPPIRAYTDEEVAKMTQGQDKKTIVFDEGQEYSEHISKRYLKSQKRPGSSIPSLQEQIQNRPLPKIER